MLAARATFDAPPAVIRANMVDFDAELRAVQEECWPRVPTFWDRFGLPIIAMISAAIAIGLWLLGAQK